MSEEAGREPGPLDTDTEPDTTILSQPADEFTAGRCPMSAAGITLDLSALLLGTLEYADDEFVSLGYENPAGEFRTAVMAPADAVTAVPKIPEDANVFFGVNPVRGPARKRAGRGTADDVTRLAALWADLDVKRGACRDLETAHAIVDDLSAMLGTRPSAITHSGNGLHPYWPVSDGHTNNGPCNLTALVKRWGRLVSVVAETRGVCVDSVYDMPRMLRVPGTFNNKAATNGQDGTPVATYADTGAPLTVAEIDERLNEYGICQEDDDTLSGEQISDPDGWRFAAETCAYVAELIDGIPGDGPVTGKGRHQWLLKQAVRLSCSLMLGCIDETDWRRAQKLLDNRLCQLRDASNEKTPRHEAAAAMRFGIDKASAKTEVQARAELGDHKHDENSNGAGSDQAKATAESAARPIPLAEALPVFQKWLHLDDVGPVLVVAAAVVANLADGDPVWVLIVGPPSCGKTEILQSISGLNYAVPTATISEAALLSGTAKRERTKNATGGLLRQIGDFGILLAKDFTSVLAQNRDTAKAAMAAMREIADGRWDRPVGTDGGRVLSWSGKCGFIGGVTPSYDRYGSIVTALGDRFLLLRMPKVNAGKQAKVALAQAEHEKQMRAELADAMAGLIAGADPKNVHAALRDDEIQELIRLAMFAALARTVVERDGYTNELLVLPQPEGPARLVKAMRRMYGALGALGVDENTRWRLMERIALDCGPAMRVPLMRELLASTNLLDAEPRRTADIAEKVGLVTKTASRVLDDLAMLNIARRTKKTDAGNSPDLWAATGWLRKHWPKADG
jgi:hypothetical protein